MSRAVIIGMNYADLMDRMGTKEKSFANIVIIKWNHCVEAKAMQFKIPTQSFPDAKTMCLGKIKEQNGE